MALDRKCQIVSINNSNLSEFSIDECVALTVKGKTVYLLKLRSISRIMISDGWE